MKSKEGDEGAPVVGPSNAPVPRIEGQLGVRIASSKFSDCSLMSSENDSSSGVNQPVNVTSLATKQKTILICVDQSDEADYAQGWALQHLCRPRDRIMIVYAAPTGDHMRSLKISAEAMKLLDSAASEATSTLARRHQQRVEHSSKAAQVDIEAHVMRGDPKERIVQWAAVHGVDIIVLGSRNITGIQRVWLGSVSTYVAEHSLCSVLVVKIPPEGPSPLESYRPQEGRRLVVGVGHSARSVAAYSWALLNVCRPRDHILVVHVWAFRETLMGSLLPGWFSRAGAHEDMANERTLFLNKLVRAGRETKLQIEGTLIEGLNGGLHVVATAHGHAAELLVVGSSEPAQSRLFKSQSVTRYCLENARMPVLVAKPPPVIQGNP